jgi:hypothetical protein
MLNRSGIQHAKVSQLFFYVHYQVQLLVGSCALRGIVPGIYYGFQVLMHLHGKLLIQASLVREANRVRVGISIDQISMREEFLLLVSAEVRLPNY